MTIDPICDFCSSPDVRWRYPARDFVISALEGAGSEGGWAACPACHALIERGLRDKLTERSARRFARKHGIPVKAVKPQLRKLHDQFWANREGPPIPHQETR